MTKYAVIVAGGAGVRMGSPVPKQFLLLGDKPVLWYTLRVFLSSYDDLSIILVVPSAHMDTARVLVGEFEADAARIQLVAGGVTRFHSVYNGLKRVSEDSVVFVHDGVRCLLTADLIYRCYEAAVQWGSAIPVVDVKDSIRLVTDSGSEAIDRRRVKLVQTPQTFLSKVLLPAFEVEHDEMFTDEATVAEAAGHRVHLVMGEVNNIKITTPEDLEFARRHLSF